MAHLRTTSPWRSSCSSLRSELRELGAHIHALTSGQSPTIADPGDLTVSVGVGARLAAAAATPVQPRSADELEQSVWLAAPGSPHPLAGSTLMVVRRIVLDVAAFDSLPVGAQERVIGRRKASGVPLSGGELMSPADLHAKEPNGRYVIPADAHLRRAHPLATGKPLMLRRGYGLAEAGERGLLFIAYQRDLDSFVQTHYRLDGGDALMRFARTTASGVFWILPGFNADLPLGSTAFPG
jgi:dye decolorizing peroxidase